MRLADLLNEQQHAIEERWLERVQPLAPRDGLTREELVDSLPLFLAELSRALRHLEDPSITSALPESSPVAEAHGRQRHHLGYTTESVAREYPLLHEVVLLVAVAAGVPVSAWEGVLLARCMGTASAEALAHFASATEQGLRHSVDRARLEHASSEEQLLRVRAAEQQARESEARLRAILASLEEGVCLHDAQGTILFANAAAARLTGVPFEQLQGRAPVDPDWRAVREDGSDYPGDEHPIMRALRTGRPVVGDVLGIRRPDGRLVWLSVNAQPLLSGDGGPLLGAVSSFADITERKQAEAEAEAERQRLRDIFEQAPVLIAIVDEPARTFTFVNPAYRALLGGLDVVGKPVREVLPDYEEQGIRVLFDEVVATGIPFVGREVPIMLPNSPPGEPQFFDFVYQPVRDAQGRVYSVLASGFEVTGLVRARQQAEALAAQREAVLEAFPEPVYFADFTGITRANAAGLSLLGVSSVEELDRSIAVFHARAQVRRVDTGEPLPLEDNLLTRALQGQTAFLDYIVRDLSTGEDRVMHGSAAPVRVGGEVVGAVSISTDITERTRAERALQERAGFERQLIGIVGHDLRQPLQTIAMAAAILLRRPGLDERALVIVQRITTASARMQRMLHDILDFTRARLGGGIPLERVQTDMAQLARETVEEVELVHAGRRVEVEVEGSGEGRWDVDRLRQVLDNLLTNALAYSPAGSPVRLSVDGRAPDEVHVHVHNAGAPIRADLLPVLFQPLTRGTATGSAERSVGLGLFIVRHLVEAHGGRVEVASSEAEGTTFSVHLPRG
ncbi:PAS domain S-box protein [Polyangium aurulentum]|uniref:PAS domain S-box protein n=1 Tax=Polyangium aurulentum TaxID=2567896 RepID=UPI0010AE14C1|nr:PAS domain S-box protein [Polyangium aurulentum]UQA57713.1 PAS domain S-box protein [Polyangium aurulentum]